MGKVHSGGITKPTGFKISANSPIDADRFAVTTLANLTDGTITTAYRFMLVKIDNASDVNDGKTYEFQGGAIGTAANWKEVISDNPVRRFIVEREGTQQGGVWSLVRITIPCSSTVYKMPAARVTIVRSEDDNLQYTFDTLFDDDDNPVFYNPGGVKFEGKTTNTNASITLDYKVPMYEFAQGDEDGNSLSVKVEVFDKFDVVNTAAITAVNDSYGSVAFTPDAAHFATQSQVNFKADKDFNAYDNSDPVASDTSFLVSKVGGARNTALQFWNYIVSKLNTGIDFITATPQGTVPTTEEGRFYYNSANNSLNYWNGTIWVEIGRGTISKVKNNTGSILAKGTTVFVSGVDAGVLECSPASAKEYLETRLVGVLAADAVNGAVTYAFVFGQVGGQDTSMYSLGQILYLSNTAGLFTNVRPTGESYVVTIGYVYSVHATEGVIGVYPKSELKTVEATDTNGFPPTERINTAITVDVGLSEFTIAAISGTSFHYYENGFKYKQENGDGNSVSFTPTEGGWWFYFEAGVLTSEHEPDTERKKHIILNHAFIAAFYYNGVDNKIEIDIFDERHGISMSPATHLQQHLSQGAFYTGGYKLGDIALGTGDADVDAQFSVTAGEYYDEDLQHTFAGLAVGSSLDVAYVLGAGLIRTAAQAGFNFLNAPAGRPYYNQITAGVGSLVEVSNGGFILMHYFGINGKDITFLPVMGQQEYATITLARAGATTEINSIQGSLPFPEMIPIATIILQCRDNYANAVKARIVGVETGVPYLDWTVSELTPGSGSNAASHINLLNVLQAGDGVEQGHIGTGAQTIYGDKGFNSPLTVPSPTADTHALNRGSANALYAEEAVIAVTTTQAMQAGRIHKITGSTDLSVTQPAAAGDIYIVANASGVTQTLSGYAEPKSLLDGNQCAFYHNGTTWEVLTNGILVAL